MSAALLDEARVEVRRCSNCGDTKPVTEFYSIGKTKAGKAKISARCRDCDNARERRQTENRVLRVRARHRATSELLKRHREEFSDLLEYFTAVVTDEARIIEERARASHDGAGVRLRSGQRRAGEDALDRINELWVEVGKCQDCSTHHGHGHACENCGTLPEAPAVVEPLPDQRGTCTCVHPTRRHDDEGCLISDCPCSGHPEEAP